MGEEKEVNREREREKRKIIHKSIIRVYMCIYIIYALYNACVCMIVCVCKITLCHLGL